MPIDTLDGLVAALRDSGLLEDAQLARLPALAERFADPAALTRELERLGWLTPYQAEELRAGRGGELVLGQYVIVSLLGQGGMGKVLKARHRLMKRFVALKVIRPALLAEPRAVTRFHREIEAVSRLSHPNIVAAFDANRVGATHFFVMEFVEGTDLQKLVKEHGPLPAALACDCVRQAALGLQHAHENGLVHRDVKPANLLLSRSAAAGAPPLVKVLDMGLARLHAGEGDGLTHTGAVMGTPDYIAPEQASDAHLVDIRADLYSLGCTLYFLLTGEPPFPGGTPLDKLFNHRFVAPRPVEVRRPDVPPAVAAVVARLMAKRPEERYQTPGELAEALAPLSAYNPDDQASTIFLPKPPAPVVEVGPGTIRPGAPAAETMGPDGGVTGLEGAAPAAPGSGKSPGDWSASPVPYVEPASPAGAVPAIAPLPKEVPAAPRRRPGLLLAAVLTLLGAVVVAGAVLAPSLSRFWQQPRPTNGETGARSDSNPGYPPTHGGGSEQHGTPKATELSPPVTPKTDTQGEKPKESSKGAPTDTGKPPVRPSPPPLTPGIVLTIKDDMSIGQAAFSSDGKTAIVMSNSFRALGFCSGLDGSQPSYRDTTFDAGGDPAVATAVAISGDGRSAFYSALDRVAGGELKNVIGLWKPPNGLASALHATAPAEVRSLAASEDGRYLLGGTVPHGDDAVVFLWDRKDQAGPKKTALAYGQLTFVAGVGLSAKGTRAMACAGRRGVYWWDINDGKSLLKNSWVRDKGSVSRAVISAAGNHILVQDDDDNLHLLSFDSGKDLLKSPINAKFVTSLALAEKDKAPLCMACGDSFGNVNMWNAATGDPVTLTGQPHDKPGRRAVLAVTIAEDCKYVYSLGADNTIRRWLTPDAK